MGGSRSRAPLRRVTCSARRPGSRSARPAPLRAFYERLRAPQGAQIAPVVTARKRCVLFWHLLTCEQDYAFERPSHRGGSAGVCPIKGVGPYTAMLVIGEVGDVGRFRSAPPPLRLGQPGRRPCAHQTAWRGSGTSPAKARWRCAGRLSRPPRSPTSLAGRCARPSSGSPERRGRKIAKVAVARKVLTLCYYALHDGEIRCLARRPNPTNATAAA
jgi:hypothetical protein